MISNTMKLKALSEAPAGWYTNICPVCGEVIYSIKKGAHLIHEPCKTAFVPVDMGELLHYNHENNKNGIRESIRTAQLEADDDMTGKTVTVSVCPDCGGYAWTFDGEPVTCAHCKPDHMTIDTFVL